jgi:chromosome segregation ATPase
LQTTAADAERVKAELETRTLEQKHLQAEWREQLTTAEALTKELESAYFDADQSNKRFEEELSRLRQSQDDLNGKLTSEQQAVADSRRRAEELESRLNGNNAELERVKAELEKAGKNEEFENRLATLQRVRDDLSGELKTEQEAAAQSKRRGEAFENRLRDNTA